MDTVLGEGSKKYLEKKLDTGGDDPLATSHLILKSMVEASKRSLSIPTPSPSPPPPLLPPLNPCPSLSLDNHHPNLFFLLSHFTHDVFQLPPNFRNKTMSMMKIWLMQTPHLQPLMWVSWIYRQCCYRS